MPRLILCEKPSVARAVAIGLRVPMAGRLPYRDDDWIIAAARGHLLEGAEPEDYDPALARWSRESLPILPETFRWKPREGGELLEQLVELLHDPEVTGVVNACDAGREGELIFKLIYRHATRGPGGRDPGQIPVERAWFSSLTPGAVARAFEALRPDEAVRGLEEAAILRDTGDWMVGINGTRAATLAAHPERAPDERGSVVSLGRVQTPTLRILMEREHEIDQYLPIPFYRVRGMLEGEIPVAVVEARQADPEELAPDAPAPNVPATDAPAPDPSGPRPLRVFEHEEDAKRAAAHLEAGEARFDAHRMEVVERAAPLPFDLATLQVEASRAFGWTAERTLRQAQNLYEKQYLSYPRTDSRFLTWDLKSQVVDAFATARELLPELASVVEGLEAQAEADELSGRPFNPSRVRDHHAIIPTGKRLSDTTPPSDDELRLLALVARRTVAAFLPPFRTEEHRVEARVPGVGGDAKAPLLLEARARRVLDAGWRLAEGGEPPAPEDAHLAAMEALAGLEPGASLGPVAAVEVEERNPRRPRAHTDGTLIRAMERAGDPADDAGAEGAAGTASPGAGPMGAAPYEVAPTQSAPGEPAPAAGPRAASAPDIHADTHADGDADPDAEDDESGEPHIGIGTPATRAAIIETLLRRRYAVRDGTAIHATTRGVRLIEALAGLELADARLTAAWEHRLGAVERGEEDAAAFETDLRNLTRVTVREIFTRDLTQLDGAPREAGPCPWCSGTIVERDKAYGCDSWKGAEAPGCGWVVFRNTRYGRIGMAEARWRREHDKPTVKASKVAFAAGDATALPDLGVEGYTAYAPPRLSAEEAAQAAQPQQAGATRSATPGALGELPVAPLPSGEEPEDLAAWDEAVLAVVEAEGPVMVRRILAALEDRGKAGGMKGRAPKKAVNRRTTALVRTGELLEVPEASPPKGQQDKVLRLPDQPQVLPRARGPRDVLEIPHRELVALLELLNHGQGPDMEAFARVLDLPDVVHADRQAWLDAAIHGEDAGEPGQGGEVSSGR